MRPIRVGPCAGPKVHEGHEIVVSGHPIGPEGHPRGLLTLWRCPVERWGGYWHDLRYRPEDQNPGGPLDPLADLP